MNGVYPVEGRPLVYRVASRTHPKVEYMCDLTALNGNGWCACNDWACRCVANMKKPHELLSNETLCYHLRRAHLYNLQVQLECILAQ